jgi:hypothetical protein
LETKPIMRDFLFVTIMTLAVAIGWFGVFRLRHSCRRTVLVAAGWWSVWAQATVTIAAIGTIAKDRVGPGIVDQFWYLSAVSALCPLIAVLGARRGRIVDWNLFVLLPLIVVLGWPALAEWKRCWNGQRLELEAPSLIAFGLVLLMGAGNFIGTRFTRPALVWIATWALTVWTFGNPIGKAPVPREAVYSFLTISQFVFWMAVAQAVRRPANVTEWDRVLQNFRDHFGIVWSLRLMTRVNEVARREEWPWKLTSNGLRRVPGASPTAVDPATDPRVDRAFRWLLKQFVDPEWIDERL